MTRERMQLKLGLICSVAGLLAYINTLDCGLCYDDTPAIIKNEDLRPNVSWSDLLWNDFWGTPIHYNTSHKSYRPLCVATFRLNYLVHELQPMGYHLVNVLLHGAVCYLYVQLCGVIFSEVWPTLIAGLLFAVHPIHTEAVASIVGRADVLSGLFFIVTILCYRRSLQCGSENTVSMVIWLLLSMLCCLCALVSKETGFTVVAVCVVYDYCVYHQMNFHSSLDLLKKISQRHKVTPLPPWFRGFIIRFIFVLAFALPTAALRLWLNRGSPSFNRHDNPPLYLPSPWRQLQWLHLCFVNGWLMLNPFTLSCDWRMGAVPIINSIVSTWNLATILTLLGVCVLGVYSITVGSLKHSKALILSLSLVIFPYIPASNLLFPVGFYVAERVLYIPSMGVCILVACCVWHIIQHTENKYLRAAVWVGVVSLLCGYLAKTLDRNRDWYSNLKLYTSVLPIFPENVLMLHNLGVEHVKQGNNDTALLLLKTAIVLGPNVTLPHLGLARLLRENDHYEEAEKLYHKAARLAPTDQKPKEIATIYYELGLILTRNETTEVNRLTTALKLWTSAHDLDPDKLEALNRKGYALLKLNRLSEAREALEGVLAVKPDHDGAAHKMGEVYLGLGELGKAENYFRRSLSSAHTNMLAKFHLAAIIIKDVKPTKERIMEAIHLLDDVLYSEPTNENALFASGIVHYNIGNISKAEQQFLNTLTIDSSHQGALYNLGFLYMNTSRYTSARETFSRLLEVNPAHYVGMAQLASCYVYLEQVEKAVNTYNEVLKRSDERESMLLALTNLGAVKKQLGQLEESIALFSRVLKIDPHNQLALQHLSDTQQ